MEQPYKTLMLTTAIRVDIYDRSWRYFGDYHHLKLPVKVTFPETVPTGEALVYEHLLEQMAVPGEAVEQAKEQLIEDFLKHTGPYLTVDGFAERLLQHKGGGRRGFSAG